MVLYGNGQMQAELPLPIGGIMSNLTLEETAQRLKTYHQKAKELGFRFSDAPLTLATLTTPAIPFFRITEDGLVDLRKGEVVGLMKHM